MGDQLLEMAKVVGTMTGGAAAVVGAGYGIEKALDGGAPATQGGYTGPAITTDQPSQPQP